MLFVALAARYRNLDFSISKPIRWEALLLVLLHCRRGDVNGGSDAQVAQHAAYLLPPAGSWKMCAPLGLQSSFLTLALSFSLMPVNGRRGEAYPALILKQVRSQTHREHVEGSVSVMDSKAQPRPNNSPHMSTTWTHTQLADARPTKGRELLA